MYNNRSLFSDYYLRELVRDDRHWRDVLAGVPALRQTIADVYKRGTPGIEQVAEAEVERRLIRPVLNALGHVYEVQPDVRSPEGTKTPDYGFFTTVEDRNRAAAAGINEYWKHALAVGDAKAWDRPLDRRLKGPGDPFTNHNPSYQIDFYLRATDLKWGILTNGRLWRLYYRDLSYRLDVYYEVNLPELLEQGDEEFNYFAAFFSQPAFIADERGERFLDRAYRGSLDYATGLSKELKDNVYEALRLLTEGFLRFTGNGLAPEDLDRIRENAFVVIYRLLFILYAEDRGFLPLENRNYGDTYSLRALAKEIAQKVDGKVGLSPGASVYWSRLQDLFRMIDAGDAALGIPPYNGGLFEESRHPELGQWRIGDSYLAQAVDMLARATAAERTGRGFVSYRELSIRELGSIYEGLLEHRPRIAEEPMVVVRDDKRERVIPERQAQGKKVLDNYQPGEVYLTLHRGERKATGSYYTPDYIVKYIVANTLGPLIEERKESSGDLVEAILSLNVLDPAMGSGHFLVEATDFLARALVETLGSDPRELEEDEIRWARREVVERCIHGVDLNPLAVELSKLSLWLHTVSRDKPLNFLDHHLRCGNSLIGAWLKDLGQLPTPAAEGAKRKAKPPTAITTLEGHGLQKAISAAVKTFHAIAEAPTQTVEDVHKKENAYQTARHALARIIDIADAWTSAYFGNEVDPDDYARLLLEAYKGDGDWPTAGEIGWLDVARNMGREERRFFHWELEFPEVFFGREGERLSEAGFGAAVGNPPYVRVGELDESDKVFFEHNFHTASGQYDAYQLFIERALSLAQTGGTVGKIFPAAWLTGDHYLPGRMHLFAVSAPTHIVVLPYDVFPDAYIDTCVLCARRDADMVTASTMVYPKRGDASSINLDFPSLAQVLSIRSWKEDPKLRIIVPRHAAEPAILAKCAAQGLRLGNVCKVERGVQPYSRAKHSEQQIRARMFHATYQKDGTYYPELLGEDLHRYALNWNGNTWLSLNDGLASTRDKQYFEGERIVIRRLLTRRFRLMASVTADRYITTDNILNMLIIQSELSPFAICALLNSRLLSFIYVRTSIIASKDDFPQVTLDGLRSLPIPRFRSTTPAKERERLVSEGAREYTLYTQSEDSAPVLSLVDARLSQKRQGALGADGTQLDVIHDLLAHLARQMIDLNIEKQAEARGFLAWLEGYVGVGLDHLRNKTKIQEYFALDGGWDEFAAAIDQNRRSIQQAKGIDVTRREPREAIRQEYEASMARLRPLLRKIELADRLIDLIVYRLYGLTEEEIAVVEGRA